MGNEERILCREFETGSSKFINMSDFHGATSLDFRLMLDN